MSASVSLLLVAAFIPMFASPSAAGNICAARNASPQRPQGTSSFFTAYPEVNQDDGRAWGRSTTTFPPRFTKAVDSAKQIMAARSRYPHAHPPYYHVSTAAIEFLIDGLPQGAQIQSASLCLYVKSMQNENERNLTADWYDVNTSTNGNNWTINKSFYSKTAKTSALAGDPLANLTPGQYDSVPLDNGAGVQTAVNNSYSYVGIRLHVNGGTPTGRNYAYISTTEGGNQPFMIISYTNPG